jgi:transcriptional regulator with XRE-family HTH domain
MTLAVGAVILRELILNKSPNPTDQYVGKRVRMGRLMLDMSQTNLADGLGLTFQQVQKYEKGTNRVSASRLQQISQIPQVPVPFFFEGGPTIEGKRDRQTGACRATIKVRQQRQSG